MRSTLRVILPNMLLILGLASFSAQAETLVDTCALPSDFSEILNCYKNQEATKPLLYFAKGSETFPGVVKLSLIHI